LIKRNSLIKNIIYLRDYSEKNSNYLDLEIFINSKNSKYILKLNKNSKFKFQLENFIK
jgi:hypothetical protein